MPCGTSGTAWNKQHLGGGWTNPNDAVKGLVNTVNTALIFVNPESGAIETNAAEQGTVKYLGRLEDLEGIPRSQTILDELPNLGSPKANYY